MFFFFQAEDGIRDHCVTGVSAPSGRRARHPLSHGLTPAPMDDLVWKSLAELARLVASKQVSPVEVVTAHLERIDALDPKLRAFITVMRESALEAARAAEARVLSGEPLPPLHGVPIALKDLYNTKAAPASYRSPGHSTTSVRWRGRPRTVPCCSSQWPATTRRIRPRPRSPWRTTRGRSRARSTGCGSACCGRSSSRRRAWSCAKPSNRPSATW